MQKTVITILYVIGFSVAFCQQDEFDSISRSLNSAKTDQETLGIYLMALEYSKERNSDSVMRYAEKAFNLSQKLNDDRARAIAWRGIGYAYFKTGNYPQAVRTILECIDFSKSIKYEHGVGYCYPTLGFIYRNQEDYQKAAGYFHAAAFLGNRLKDDSLFFIGISELAYLKCLTREMDSALYWNDLSFPLSKKLNSYNLAGVLDTYGIIYESQGNYELAKKTYLDAIKVAGSMEEYHGLTWYCNHLAGLYQRVGKPDSSIYWAREALFIGRSTSYPYNMIESAGILSGIYDSLGKRDSAYTYLQIKNHISDSLFSQEKSRNSQWLIFNRSMEEEKERAARKAFVNQVRLYAVLFGLLVLSLVSILLLRNILQRKKTNKVLEERNQTIQETLNDLRATQAQLIQSEKMASLGELTAGIAHEIQNPLNFVNNFSEVNKELLNELKDEAEKGNAAQVKAIADDIIENQEKINHHGKRADAIVRGMLQHSRTSSGEKEPTDINALCDEYLRLAYHGFRAKDKSFNAITKTEFDNNIEKIYVVPQDIGRVILNLINNSFYAVSEKLKQNLAGYEPFVAVNTKKLNARPDDPVGRGKIEISIRDNGNGIPESIKEKIFQPFFTTKPTGQGTGLGLSLSYDIVKAHGGEIKVKTKETEGSEFIIMLPR